MGELFEWMLLQIWPNVNEVARTIIKESVEPQFDKELDKCGIAGRALKGIHFSHFDLGDKPPRIENVKAYRQTAREHHGIEIDVVIRMNISPNINLVIMGYDFGIKRLQFEGHMSCIFKPILNKKPIIGCCQVFLLKRPVLDFDLSGNIKRFNSGLLHRVMKNVIVDQIYKKMALPNRININLVKEWDIEEDIVEVQNPRPDFVLRIRAKSAANLPNADFQISQLFGGKRSGSDPYCNIRMGAQVFRSSTMKNNCDPVWPSEGATGDFAIFNHRQEVEFDIYDDDFGLGKDDHLVGTVMCVDDLLSHSSHVLNMHPAKKILPQNNSISDDVTKPDSGKKIKGWQKVKSELKSLRSKKVKVEEIVTLEIDVVRFDLVPFTESLMEKTRLGAGPSEALLGVS